MSRRPKVSPGLARPLATEGHRDGFRAATYLHQGVSRALAVNRFIRVPRVIGIPRQVANTSPRAQRLRAL